MKRCRCAFGANADAEQWKYFEDGNCVYRASPRPLNSFRWQMRCRFSWLNGEFSNWIDLVEQEVPRRIQYDARGWKYTPAQLAVWERHRREAM